MLNYFERIDLYKSRNYFQITEDKYLDLYYKPLQEWIQDIVVAKDLLQLASEKNLKNEYDILFVRIFGGQITEDQKNRLNQTFETANIILAEELGASAMWKTLKLLPETADKHFSVISIVDFKKKPTKINLDDIIEEQEEEKNESRKRTPRNT